MLDKDASRTRDYEEFRQEWRTLGAVTIAASFGFPTLAFFSIGIFAPIFAEEYGWSFGSMMGGIFIASLAILLFGPFVGRYIDKRGARKIAALSLIAFGIGYMSLAFSSGSIVQYFASWAIMSIAGVGATAISFTHIISNAFHRRRGLALGVALSSSGISAMLVKPLAGVTIALLGWRETILIIGLLPILIGAPVLFWGIRKGPSPSVEGEDRVSSRPERQEGVTVAAALRGRPFWILLLAFTAIAFGNGAPIPNLENILGTLQFDAAETVAIASLIGAALICGRVLGGWLIDRFWAPLVGFVLLVCAAAGCWMLAQETLAYGEAQLAVILIAAAAGIEYDLLSFLVARYLGRRHYGAIYSVIFGVFAVSAGIGPVALGLFFDRWGGYGQGLLLCAGLLFLAGVALLGLGRYPALSALSENDHPQKYDGPTDSPS